MKRNLKIAAKDNVLLCIGLFLFFILLQPFGIRDAIGDSLWQSDIIPQLLGECILIFICTMIAEIITCFVFRLPSDYSKDWSYQLKRGILFFLILLIILPAVIGQYFCIIQWGWENWHYEWIGAEGNFTLKWYFMNLGQAAAVCIFVAIYWIFLTRSRMKEYKIQELLSLNEAIEQTEEVSEEKLKEVLISGDSKESLSVSPSDILYIESIANYLSIWYFLNGELKQKRIRNTLKNVEEILADYPFLLHCHRAFLVNTRFITHVDGNAAGCQLHLFSIERTVPVSKANIEALRESLRQ